MKFWDMVYSRSHLKFLATRLAEPARFIQILAGPRQVGKTTLIRQLLSDRKPESYTFAATDQPVESVDSWLPQPQAILAETPPNQAWLIQVWERSRVAAEKYRDSYVLVIDEIQKIPRWSEVIKGLWDADRANGLNMHVVLLGSSPLLIQKGLTESLAGRYEPIPVTHWSLNEMQDAFGYSLEQYLYFGGYPGAAQFIHDEERWRSYVLASLIQSNIEKDILQMTRVEKPALLKRLFELGSRYSGQIISYTKLQGQLQDAGNTTTLAHYLDLLSQSGLLTGMNKHAGQVVRQRASSPKMMVLNTALMTAGSNYSYAQAQADRSFWGRLVESAVGAHLINTATKNCAVQYWRESPHEVDFVISQGKRLTCIEVKSGKASSHTSGLEKFAENFKVTRKIIIGELQHADVSLAELLSSPTSYWLDPAEC